MAETARRVVDESGLERELAKLGALARSPREGVFGPASMLWRVDREAAIFLGAGRALLLQLAHPFVAQAIADHSPSLGDPIGRFHRTFAIVFTLVFGTIEEARAAAQRLHCRHAAIAGAFRESVGSFAAGSRYIANDVEALAWVHATLVETALIAHDLVLPPLSAVEREEYYAEARRFAGFFGLGQEDLPASFGEFSAYVGGMSRSEVLTVSPAARRIAGTLFTARAGRLRIPYWYRALSAQLLPERLRTAFGLAYGPAERRAAERALAAWRRIYPALPSRLRTVGPYQEAVARLAGKARPGFYVETLNRLWIGAPRMSG
jgi:uncharacterized protein (DUF2236 family)